MKRSRLIASALVMSIVMIAAATNPTMAQESLRSPPFKAHVQLPFEEEGVHAGAAYRISVPANWNGTLLVYAHGMDLGQLSGPIRVAPGREGGGSANVEADLLASGYALAGSSYSESGWAVKSGVQDTLALTNYFNGRVGNPEHVIIWGLSMGGVIALESIEKYPGVYDGAITESANSAGAPMNFDRGIFYQLVYDVAFGWPEQWGQVGDVRDDLNYNTDVRPILMGQLYPPSAKSEFLRLAAGQPSPVFYQMGGWGLPMALATSVAASMEQVAKGACLQNLDAPAFTLSAADLAYLQGMGLNAQPLIDEINARRNIEASIPARTYLERYATFTGDIKHPVITLHSMFDPYAIVENDRVYRDTVNSAGKGDLLLQAYTSAPIGHGVFTKNQYIQALKAMSQWLETGTRPEHGSFFKASDNFLPVSWTPPPWPYR